MKNDNRIPTMIRMYNQGYNPNYIARTLHAGKPYVVSVLKEAGVFIPSRKTTMLNLSNKRVVSEYIEQTTMQANDKITRQEIEYFRRRVPIGLEFVIVTPKGIDPEVISMVARSVKKTAEVVNTTNRNFCQVRLQGTHILESVPWSTLIVMNRRGEICI